MSASEIARVIRIAKASELEDMMVVLDAKADEFAAEYRRSGDSYKEGKLDGLEVAAMILSRRVKALLEENESE